MVKRFILTGTPGCGKTSVLRFLEQKQQVVVEESATDVIALKQALGIAEPWKDPIFVDEIVGLQKQRQLLADHFSAPLQFFDRSPICSYALSLYLGYPISSFLQEELERIEKQNIYERKVFFLENLGFCAPTEARQISFEESLKFEKIHEEAYLFFGYQCEKISLKPIAERALEILKKSSI
jgi:predicted ATPase